MGINDLADEGQVDERARNWEQLEFKTAKAYEEVGERLAGFGLFASFGIAGLFILDYAPGKLLLAAGATGASIITCQIIKPGIDYLVKKRESDRARIEGLMIFEQHRRKY